MRIAIFGLHPDTQASYRPDEWDQVWRMAHDPEAPQAHRIFEAHSEPIARKYGGEAYLAKLREYADDGLLTTLWPYEGFPATCHMAPYGLKPQSSVAFMASIAIRRHGDPDEDERLGFFGVDMADGEEYGYQRPDMAYLIGMARGMGIGVHIDPASSLLKSQWTAGIYGHPDNINDMVYRLT
jgi:hypothetical protein